MDDKSLLFNGLRHARRPTWNLVPVPKRFPDRRGYMLYSETCRPMRVTRYPYWKMYMEDPNARGGNLVWHRRDPYWPAWMNFDDDTDPPSGWWSRKGYERGARKD